jgi:hypothetical protein
LGEHCCLLIPRHVAKFATWQSLETDGVDDEQKVALMLEWLSALDGTIQLRDEG